VSNGGENYNIDTADKSQITNTKFQINSKSQIRNHKITGRSLTLLEKIFEQPSKTGVNPDIVNASNFI